MTTREDLIARLACNANDPPAWIALAKMDARSGRRRQVREMAAMGCDASWPPQPLSRYMVGLLDDGVVVVHPHSHPTMSTADLPPITEWCCVYIYRERT
jgi:hypothetical protein